MKQAALFAAFAVLIPAFAAAQEPLVRFQPEPDFDAVVSRAVQAAQPQDAFAGVAECRVVDARFFAPVSLEAARKMLQPCMAALSLKYGAQLEAALGTPAVQDRFNAQVEMLMLRVPASASITSPLMRDLNRALALRANRILGHRAAIERVDDKRVEALDASAAGPAQDAIDSCMLPDVVRRVESGADFIKYYGGCLRRARALRVVDMKPWPGHQLGVVLLTEGDHVAAQSLTGSVRVSSAKGPVEVELVAYTQTVYRP